MPPPPKLHQLIERFDDNLAAYKQGHYNETQARREFVDPLFKLLGWDIDNEQGYAEAYKDVVHEDAIKVSGGTKAPDYGFRIGGVRKFFVEAKKPSVDIRNDVHPAYQLRRYAWSAKLPLSILTDFEELAVYDCRIKPDKGDKAATARVLYFKYTDYAEHWDEIAGIFSPRGDPQRILRQIRRGHSRQTRHRRGRQGLFGRDRALARRARPQHRAAQPRPEPTSAQLRGAGHHRPHPLPAHLRGSGHRAIRHAAQPGQRRPGLRAADAALPPRRRPLQLRPVSLRGRKGPQRAGRPRNPGPGHRRQGSQGHPQEPLLPRQPLRVLRPADRDPRPGLRAVPGQGYPFDLRPPGQGRGKTGGAQGRRRLLHAVLHRGRHRAADRGQAAGGSNDWTFLREGPV